MEVGRVGVGVGHGIEGQAVQAGDQGPGPPAQFAGRDRLPARGTDQHGEALHPGGVAGRVLGEQGRVRTGGKLEVGPDDGLQLPLVVQRKRLLGNGVQRLAGVG